MKIRDHKKTFVFLLLLWFLVNLVQALFMDILSDEAYYGLYGKYLDWGYYDHPPMVAVLIRISSLIFTGNLGIRFMTILLQLGTILIIWRTIDQEDPDSKSVITFFIIAASISMFSAYGAITTPDAPLLFFTALFLFAYREFLKESKWTAVLLLAVAMAGMVYSKYQAVLVIGFVVLSNLKLLKSSKFWIAGLLALIFLSPHIYWQMTNDFPSFKYHLISRSVGFKWKYFLEYFPYQTAVFNPVTLGAVIYLLIKYKPSGQFNSSLYYQIIGFIGFFWLTCYRGHVEPHWTIACSIPMIILLSEKSREYPSLFKYTRRYILPSLLLLLLIRIFLMTDLQLNKELGFSGKEEKYRHIESIANGLPVIFTGSFQRPSLYTFFTGKESTVISSVYTRQTQFDIWQFERKYHNKPVFICTEAYGKYHIYGSEPVKFAEFKADSLQTVNRMEISCRIAENPFHPGDSVSATFSLKNPYNHKIDFNHHQFPVNICLVFLKGRKIFVKEILLPEPVGIISPGEIINESFTTVIPDLPAGNYQVGLCLNNLFGPSLNSRFTKIKIKNDDR